MEGMDLHFKMIDDLIDKGRARDASEDLRLDRLMSLGHSEAILQGRIASRLNKIKRVKDVD